MSTSYYGMKAPITSIRPEERGVHTHVGIWVNHAKAGTLVYRNDEWAEGKWMYVNNEIALIHTHAGKDGIVISAGVERLPADQQLMDEYGDLTTAGEVRGDN